MPNASFHRPFLRQVKACRDRGASWQMAKLIFRCVQTGMNVQVWLPDEAPTDRTDSYESVTCRLHRLHLVNKTTARC